MVIGVSMVTSSPSNITVVDLYIKTKIQELPHRDLKPTRLNIGTSVSDMILGEPVYRLDSESLAVGV